MWLINKDELETKLLVDTVWYDNADADVAYNVVHNFPAIVQTREESDLKLRVAQLEREVENKDAANRKLRARLDAAVQDLEIVHDCGTCIHADTCDPELCDCEDGDQYTWRGPQDEKEDRDDE